MQNQVINNFGVDKQLLQDALQISGLANQKETIEEGLRLLVKIYRQQEIRKFRGKLKWDGDLESMRQAHAD